MVSRWEILEDCERSQGESAHAFVDRYEGAYEAVKNVCGVTIHVTKEIKDRRWDQAEPHPIEIGSRQARLDVRPNGIPNS